MCYRPKNNKSPYDYSCGRLISRGDCPVRATATDSICSGTRDLIFSLETLDQLWPAAVDGSDELLNRFTLVRKQHIVCVVEVLISFVNISEISFSQ